MMEVEKMMRLGLKKNHLKSNGQVPDVYVQNGRWRQGRREKEGEKEEEREGEGGKGEGGRGRRGRKGEEREGEEKGQGLAVWFGLLNPNVAFEIMPCLGKTFPEPSARDTFGT